MYVDGAAKLCWWLRLQNIGMAALNTVFGNSESREVWGRLYRTKTVVAIKAKHKDAYDLKGHVFGSCSRHLRSPDKSCAHESACCRIVLLANDSTNSGLFISIIERDIAFN